MSRVLILGASGFVGLGVAKAFEHKGYTVYGLTRSEEKAKILAKEGIIPIVGTVDQTDKWVKIAHESDILIDAVADFANISTTETILKGFSDAKSKDKTKIVIYTSGGAVLEATGKLTDERSPIKPPAFAAWRPAIEKRYLEIGAVVLRPVMVYGGQGSIFALLFKAAADGKLEIQGNGKNFWSTVHVDDLGDAYVAAAQKGHAIAGEAINISSYDEPVQYIAESIARVTGFKGEIKCVPPVGPLNEILASNFGSFNNTKAKNLLGWSPSHLSFTANVDVYYLTWKAHL